MLIFNLSYIIIMIKQKHIMLIFILFITVGIYLLLINNYKKISVFGYGSLMSIKEIKKTCPSANNFRPGILDNFIRSFSFIHNNKYNNQAISTIKPSNSNHVRGVIFDIPEYELNNFLQREKHYNIKKLNILDNNKLQECYVCVECNSEYNDFIKCLSCGSTIIPDSDYLILCLNNIFEVDTINNSFHNLKTNYINNFLNDSYLADCKTNIKQYIKQNSSQFSKKINFLINY
jgi:hypothetical protein